MVSTGFKQVCASKVSLEMGNILRNLSLFPLVEFKIHGKAKKHQCDWMCDQVVEM